MIDTPFQLLDSNSEETGLVCGLMAAAQSPLTTAVRTPSQAFYCESKSSHQEGRMENKGQRSDAILHYCHNYGLELQLPEELTVGTQKHATHAFIYITSVFLQIMAVWLLS